MGALSEIILSFLELLEAEGRTFRAALVRLLLAITLVGAVGALALAGLGLIVWAIYLYLRVGGLTPPTSALLAGLITLGLTGVLAWSAKNLVR